MIGCTVNNCAFGLPKNLINLINGVLSRTKGYSVYSGPYFPTLCNGIEEIEVRVYKNINKDKKIKIR